MIDFDSNHCFVVVGAFLITNNRIIESGLLVDRFWNGHSTDSTIYEIDQNDLALTPTIKKRSQIKCESGLFLCRKWRVDDINI